MTEDVAPVIAPRASSVADPMDSAGNGDFRSRVAHNTVLSFLGLAVPLALAFFIMPVAARYLGPARFGLLGLAWAITEYLTLFDLGLGRALVKFVADSLQLASRELSDVVSISMAMQLAAGVIGGGLFVLAGPLLVERVFHVPPSLESEALGVFRVVGLSLPVVLLMSGQRSILEGAQRFDLSASLKMLSSVASLGIPAIGAVAGWSLPFILSVVLAARFTVALLYAVAIRRALPDLRFRVTADRALVRRIVGFGGWVLVSNTVSPLLVYFDRFALGTIAGLAAVGFYTAPYEGVTRLLLVPVSVFSSLLPALTALAVRRDRNRFTQLVGSSERVLAAAMALPLVVIAVYAPELLRIWLGDSYARVAANALRLLAVGVFANSLANPLFVALYANNRPDLPAKFHLIELLIHVPLTIALIHAFGVTGAAAGWAFRAVLDMTLLLIAATRTSAVNVLAGGPARLLQTIATIGAFAAALVGSRILRGASPIGGAIAGLAVIGAFCVGAWVVILAPAERATIRSTVRAFARLLPARPIAG